MSTKWRGNTIRTMEDGWNVKPRKPHKRGKAALFQKGWREIRARRIGQVVIIADHFFPFFHQFESHVICQDKKGDKTKRG